MRKKKPTRKCRYAQEPPPPHLRSTDYGPYPQDLLFKRREIRKVTLIICNLQVQHQAEKTQPESRQFYSPYPFCARSPQGGKGRAQLGVSAPPATCRRPRRPHRLFFFFLPARNHGPEAAGRSVGRWGGPAPTNLLPPDLPACARCPQGARFPEHERPPQGTNGRLGALPTTAGTCGAPRAAGRRLGRTGPAVTTR